MNPAELYYMGFYPKDEKQQLIFEDFRKLRALFGTPHRISYLRSRVRTRAYTRTVYPPGWKPV